MKCVEMPLSKALLRRGWAEEKPNSWSLKKNNWNIVYDTGSWIEVGTLNTPRLFDVPVPKDGFEEWTANLIEHLCKSDDLIHVT